MLPANLDGAVDLTRPHPGHFIMSSCWSLSRRHRAGKSKDQVRYLAVTLHNIKKKYFLQSSKSLKECVYRLVCWLPILFPNFLTLTRFEI